jgi:hypothetical protein
MIDQYIDEIEAERVKIRKVLFGKSKVTKQFLFPLYQDRSGNSSDLNILRGIMRDFNKSITEEKEAREFCKKIHDFNEKYSSTRKERISDSSTGSTISTDHLGVDDYYEDTGDSEEAPEEGPALLTGQPKTALPPPRKPPQRNNNPPIAVQQTDDESTPGRGPWNLHPI